MEQQKQQQDQRINEEASRAINRMACELDDSIQLHRNEIDTLAQQKAWQERALSHLSNELVDLERVGLGSVSLATIFVNHFSTSCTPTTRTAHNLAHYLSLYLQKNSHLLSFLGFHT